MGDVPVLLTARGGRSPGGCEPRCLEGVLVPPSPGRGRGESETVPKTAGSENPRGCPLTPRASPHHPRVGGPAAAAGGGAAAGTSSTGSGAQESGKDPTLTSAAATLRVDLGEGGLLALGWAWAPLRGTHSRVAILQGTAGEQRERGGVLPRLRWPKEAHFPIEGPGAGPHLHPSTRQLHLQSRGMGGRRASRDSTRLSGVGTSPAPALAAHVAPPAPCWADACQGARPCHPLTVRERGDI